MYIKRIQILNYGPIENLDISFDFLGQRPNPILLVGENGSGKSLLLSHLVNALTIAKENVFPDAPEVDNERAYKIRSPLYIQNNKEYYFSRVDFEQSLYVEEIHSRKTKNENTALNDENGNHDLNCARDRMAGDSSDHIYYNFDKENSALQLMVRSNCILYFPANRFEEPAWLNLDNLRSKVNYSNPKKVQDYTERNIINYAPLQANKNWLLDVIYDRSVIEAKLKFMRDDSSHLVNQDNVRVTPFLSHEGGATQLLENAALIARKVLGNDNLSFGLGLRNNRNISLKENENILVPNLFQLSTGQTSILNLFLSIMRDFDLCGETYKELASIRGLAIIDEVDTHLHAVHQFEILPKLIGMFPNVQFIFTTHSPLFVMGMERTFGENGVSIYQLPNGSKIHPETFSEFKNAYEIFKSTTAFEESVRTAIISSNKPLIVFEGDTDVDYATAAANALGETDLLENVEFHSGNGHGTMNNYWKNLDQSFAHKNLNKLVFVYDCDISKPEKNKPEKNIGNRYYRFSVPVCCNNPIEKGIENLFSKETLQRAMNENKAFINIADKHNKLEEGQSISVPEKWEISTSQKRNLCTWLCNNGTDSDFKNFIIVFDKIKRFLTEGS